MAGTGMMMMGGTSDTGEVTALLLRITLPHRADALATAPRRLDTAAPVVAPPRDQCCNAATASATSVRSRRAARASGILAPSAGTSTASGCFTLVTGSTGTVRP